MGWFGSDTSHEPSDLKDFKATLKPVTLWSVNVGRGNPRFNRLVPAVTDEAVYTVNAEGVLQARKRENGKLLWQVETGLPVSAGPGLGDDMLLVGTAEGEVAAYDQEEGKLLWRKSLSGEVLAVPAAADGVVVVHTEDGRIYGLDDATGDQLWLYNQGTPVLTLHGTSSPVISGGVVYCGLAGGKLVALALDKGIQAWESYITVPSGGSELERMVDVDADPLIYSGAVYAASYQGNVAALGVGTGKALWKRKASVYNNMAADWLQLVVSDANGWLWSIDPDSGAARWRVKDLAYRRLSPPAILGDYVVVGDYKGYLHWFSSDDGAMVARSRVGSSEIVAQPVENDGMLYVLSTDGTLTVFKLPQGNVDNEPENDADGESEPEGQPEDDQDGGSDTESLILSEPKDESASPQE